LFNISLGFKYSDISAGWQEKDSITHPTGATQTTIYSPVILDVMLNELFALTLTIPYYNFYQVQPDTAFGKVIRSNGGIGDITLLLMYKLFANPSLFVGAGLKMPTGSYKIKGEPIINGQESYYPTNMQLGTGTWDPSIGIFFSQELNPFCLFGNLSYRFTGNYSDLGNKIGNELLFNVGTSYLLSQYFSPLLIFNTFYTSVDDGPNTNSANTGVFYIYLSPGIAYNPAPEISFQLMYEFPLYRHVNRIQVTPKYNINFLVSYNF